jgi:hypothetical protein
MVQYLHFRILEFPLSMGQSHLPFMNDFKTSRMTRRIHWRPDSSTIATPEKMENTHITTSNSGKLVWWFVTTTLTMQAVSHAPCPGLRKSQCKQGWNMADHKWDMHMLCKQLWTLFNNLTRETCEFPWHLNHNHQFEKRLANYTRPVNQLYNFQCRHRMKCVFSKY